MDPMPVEPQNDIPQANVSPSLPVKHSYPFVKILIGLVLLAIGIGIGWFLAKQSGKPSFILKQTISTYEDCLDAKGSVVQESYPATCVTSDGTRFTQSLTDEEKQNLLPPDSSANWKEFADPTGKFTFKYPKDLILKDQNSEPDTSEYTQLFKVFNTFMDTNVPSFVVRVRSGLNAQQLEKEDFNDMEGHVDYKIIKREVISLSGKPAVKVNVFVGPEEDYQEDSGSVYIYSDIDPQESLSIKQLRIDKVQFDQILSTYKFQNNESTNSTTTANWKTYKINILGISFMYPEDWFINKYDDSGAIRLQNYDPNSASGREYSPELDKGKFGLVVGPFVINGVSPQLATIAKLKDFLQKENAKECFYYGDASGIRIARDSKESSINGISVYSRSTKCSRAPDSAWAPENFILDGKGKVVIANPILDISGGKDPIDQILSTFKFLDN